MSNKVSFDGRRYVCREVVEYKGKKKRIAGLSAKGRTEARKAFNRKVDEWKKYIDDQDKVLTGHELLSDAMTRWYEMYKRPLGLTQNTIITDEDTMKQLFETELGEMFVLDITADDIQKNLNELSNKCSDSIIKKRYLMLKMFFKYFSMTRQTFNVMEVVRLPKSKKKKAGYDDAFGMEKTAYTDEQLQQLYAHLKRPFNKSKIGTSECGTVYGRFLLVILYEYLRYGEAAELRVKDIDFKKSIIHVRRQWSSRERAVRAPKYNSKRDVPIAKEVRRFLLESCVGKDSDDLVFRSGELNKDRTYLPSAQDGHIRENVAIETLHRAEEQLGLPRHSIHDLRHDGISYFVRRGIRAEDVSRFAGHKSVSFTMDRYYRHTEEISEDTMKLVSGMSY